MTKKYRQFQLKQKHETHEVILNCWLPSVGLKEGFKVKLEAYPEEWWIVTKASGTEMELESIHTDFKRTDIIGELEQSKRSGLKYSK